MDQGCLVRDVGYLDVLAKGVQVNPVNHLLDGLGVCDYQQYIAQVDHGKQVDDAPLVGGQYRGCALACGQVDKLVGGETIEEVQAIGPGNAQAARGRAVEKSNALPHCPVLFSRVAEALGQLPAVGAGESRSRLLLSLAQRCGLVCCRFLHLLAKTKGRPTSSRSQTTLV